MEYYCYLLYSPLKNVTYIGITNNVEERLKKHNGITSGGAKSTRKTSDWEYRAQVLFPDKELAMSFEWYAKHIKNVNNKWVKTKGLDQRLEIIDALLKLEKFKNCKKIELYSHRNLDAQSQIPVTPLSHI